VGNDVVHDIREYALPWLRHQMQERRCGAEEPTTRWASWTARGIHRVSVVVADLGLSLVAHRDGLLLRLEDENRVGEHEIVLLVHALLGNDHRR
jgi:hypothetical protein